MDIDLIVVVTPNPNPTGDPKLDELTARVSHDEHSNQLGKLHRGETYRAVEEYMGMYRLKVHKKAFPFKVPAGTDPWADKDFLPPAPSEPPVPEPSEGLSLLFKWLRAMAEATLKVLPEK